MSLPPRGVPPSDSWKRYGVPAPDFGHGSCEARAPKRFYSKGKWVCEVCGGMVERKGQEPFPMIGHTAFECVGEIRAQLLAMRYGE